MLRLGEVGIEYKARLKEINDEWEAHVARLELKEFLDEDDLNKERTVFFGFLSRYNKN